MAKFKLNDQVNIVHTSLSGTVTGAELDLSDLSTKFKVAYSDKHGEAQERFFHEHQIAAVSEQPSE